MKRVYLVIIAALFAAVFIVATISLARAQGISQNGGERAVQEGDGSGGVVVGQSGPGINHTERISIPFGIADVLPLRQSGQQVVVIGHGSCTAGEMVTVLFTVTHSATSQTATGQMTEACAGEAHLQIWSGTATATGAALPAGAAQVDGLATTYAAGVATDSFLWSRPDVTLAWFNYLPIIAGEALDNG